MACQVHGLLGLEQQTPEVAGHNDPWKLKLGWFTESLVECKVLLTPGTDQGGSGSSAQAGVWSLLLFISNCWWEQEEGSGNGAEDWEVYGAPDSLLLAFLSLFI